MVPLSNGILVQYEAKEGAAGALCQRLFQAFAMYKSTRQDIEIEPSVQVHLLVRGEKMRASGAMIDRVTAHDKVTVHFQTRVEDAYGDGKGLAGLRLLEGPDSTCLLDWHAHG